jgi:DtxR family Mn-dependent transcriptional regulator
MKARPVNEAVEDYVKAIYLLEQSEGKATTKALALALDVAAPSVTAMIKRLHAMRLVRYTRYRGVSLTPAGKRMVRGSRGKDF